MSVVTIKGARAIMECNEKLYLHYFKELVSFSPQKIKVEKCENYIYIFKWLILLL
jgi:hypothetical protein